jgi:cell division transport system ATP-binding protein
VPKYVYEITKEKNLENSSIISIGTYYFYINICTMENTVLELKDAAIFQKESLVLNEVNLHVSKGEFVYLIGKTGSGKSSFMKTLYGDLPLKKGEGSIVDFNLKTLKEKDIPFLRRKLGIVFQDFKLLPDRNINQNMLFVLKATGWKDKAKMDTQVQVIEDHLDSAFAFLLHELLPLTLLYASASALDISELELVVDGRVTLNLQPVCRSDRCTCDCFESDTDATPSLDVCHIVS